MTPRAIRLDVHAHVIPLREDDVQAVPGVQWMDAGHVRVDGADLAKRELYQPQDLLGWMDTNRVAQAWISIPPTLYRPQLDATAAREWASCVNAALVRVAAHAPQRLAPMLHLPVAHPAVAAQIVSIHAVDAGCAKFAMCAGDAARGVMLSHADYEPLWAALERVRAFLFLHPSRGCDSRFDAFYLQNLLNNPLETALAAAHLAMSGVLERHPNITFCLAHGGGATAAVAGRLERGQATGRPGADLGGEGVRRGLRRFCVDCITHDPAALQLAAAVHGSDRILFGSDWPFEMGLFEPHTQLAGVDAELLQGIMVENPPRLLRVLGV
ncbi:MAG: amidohydrolase family protein [Burkholderiaceae bacterium]